MFSFYQDVSYCSRSNEVVLRTLLNQSDISDLVEKSFCRSCWISRAARH